MASVLDVVEAYDSAVVAAAGLTASAADDYADDGGVDGDDYDASDAVVHVDFVVTAVL